MRLLMTFLTNYSMQNYIQYFHPCHEHVKLENKRALSQVSVTITRLRKLNYTIMNMPDICIEAGIFLVKICVSGA